jgi:hypothetical protein
MKKYYTISIGLGLLVAFITALILELKPSLILPLMIRWSVVLIVGNGIVAWILCGIFVLPKLKNE